MSGGDWAEVKFEPKNCKGVSKCNNVLEKIKLVTPFVYGEQVSIVKLANGVVASMEENRAVFLFEACLERK